MFQILTVVVPLFMVATTAITGQLRVWAALVGFIIALLDALVLDPVQKAMKLRAARVQERFDCSVLDLPWDSFRVGSKPDPEDILDSAAAHQKRGPDLSLRDWYPAAVSDLPVHLARIICQRANCWWDMKLRRLYRAVILGAVSALAVLVLIVGVSWQIDLPDIVLGAIAPLTPLVAWSLREARRQQEAIDGLERLKVHSQELWQKALSGELSADNCTQQSRWLQSELFERRRTNPLIFDKVYWLLQGRFESQMTGSAAHMIQEARDRRPQLD